MTLKEAFDVVSRKLKTLLPSALRLAIQSLTSFIIWLKEFNRWIHDQLDEDGLVNDLYKLIRAIFF